jgi:uncharacterized SAM-binding protein YcdF (DUF218 family)
MQHGKPKDSILTPLEWFYERLTLHDQPRPVDLIFVHAGRMERKQYGLQLYRAGLAPRLLLSIGRFEVSKMPAADFAVVDELIARRDRTAPGERHFFYEMTASGATIETTRLTPWNTYGEVAALREYLKRGQPRSLIVVSTDVHLRRVAGTFAQVFHGAAFEIRYCPVPAASSSVRQEEWWSRFEDRKYIFRETVKLAAYQAILKMPDGMIRRIMRLKNLLG